MRVLKSGFLTPFVAGRFSFRLGRPCCSKGLLEIVALLLQTLQFFQAQVHVLLGLNGNRGNRGQTLIIDLNFLYFAFSFLSRSSKL